jgi:hypothetical protein
MKKQTPEPMMPGAGDHNHSNPKSKKPTMPQKIDHGIKIPVKAPKSDGAVDHKPKMVPGMSYNKLKKMESEKK